MGVTLNIVRTQEYDSDEIIVDLLKKRWNNKNLSLA
jgi:hypothetical protein